MHIVITGAAGVVGQAAVAALGPRHQLTLLDLRAHPAQPTTLVDLADAEAVTAAIPAADVLFHFAAIPTEVAAYAEIVRSNLLATAILFDVARAKGIPRIVFASTMQVYGKLTHTPTAWPLNPMRHAEPDSHYACSKLHGEHLGAMMARRHGLAVISMRLGWYVRRTDASLHIAPPAYLLSMEDARRLFICCAEAPHAGSVVVNGVSLGGAEMFDLAPGRQAIGFEPQDSAAEAMRQHLARIEKENKPQCVEAARGTLALQKHPPESG